ncbi:hypothetical protein E3V33_04805 [Candidatus Marinimicrobia bacterium MT.SAG.4]|nr:hypothetical protein E3V33_04805 [Candidatus Marinimicrobia bacterium MT.SAG.4]
MNVNISHWSSKEIVDIPITLITDSDISDGAKITLTYLLSYKGYGGLSVSQARVADDLDKSRYLICKHYLELERYGYIILKRVKGASSDIILTRKSVQND